MKMERFVLIAALGLTIGVGLLYRIRRQAESSNQSLLNDWGNEALAHELSRKLNLGRGQVLDVLQGARNQAIASQIDRAIDRIKLRFMRTTSPREVEVTLDVAYADGTSYSAQTSSAWDDLPEAVRAKFLRSGQRMVEHGWSFPWAVA